MKYFLLAGILAASGLLAPSEDLDLVVVKTKEITADDIPLEFVLQKARMGRGSVQIWGKVTNTTNTIFRFPRATFTTRDGVGKFLGRQQVFFDPKQLGPGQTAFVDGIYIETEGRRPTTLEYGISGDLADDSR